MSKERKFKRQSVFAPCALAFWRSDFVDENFFLTSLLFSLRTQNG
jgi:hypothetical protein